jgi:uncharacterized protein (TIGR03435 family)
MKPDARITWTATVCSLAVFAFLAVSAHADPQSGTPADKRPAFEAATIKLAAPDAVRNRVMPSGPNRLNIPSMTLVWLVYTAYGDGGFNTAMRVTGGPDWVNRTAFAVEGVASADSTPRQKRLMLQTLLEERFALKVGVENQTANVLTLVVDRADGKLGPQVKEWDGTCRNGKLSEEDDPAAPRCPSGYLAGRLLLDGATMFSVAEALSLPQARPLLGNITVDQTGLKGRYTMALDYQFAPPRPLDPAKPPEFAGPSLFTAVREQWGLRIVPGQGPFKAVVIESAQLPAGN